MSPFNVQMITLVPDVWPMLLHAQTGLVGRAFQDGKAQLHVCDLRQFGKGLHKQVDDAPYGGGAGMVLGVEPLHQAILSCRARAPGPVVLLDPRGERFSQRMASQFAQMPGLTLICGRYEGVDERVRHYVDKQVSMGDFVLSAGDPAAWAMVDAIVRLLPGVLGNHDSLREESFAQGLEYPQYTRPRSYEQYDVPEVLCSGDHAAIAQWRAEQARQITLQYRPDLA